MNRLHTDVGTLKFDDWISGLRYPETLEITAASIQVRGVKLLLLTASPSGNLKGACFLGGTCERK